MAGTTGLEPATSAVTGQRSNQLSYVPKENLYNRKNGPWESRISASWKGFCTASAAFFSVQKRRAHAAATSLSVSETRTPGTRPTRRLPKFGPPNIRCAASTQMLERDRTVPPSSNHLPLDGEEIRHGKRQPASDVAWNVFVPARPAHWILRTALYQRPHGTCRSPGGRDERHFPACSGRRMERGELEAGRSKPLHIGPHSMRLI